MRAQDPFGLLTEIAHDKYAPHRERAAIWLLLAALHVVVGAMLVVVAVLAVAALADALPWPLWLTLGGLPAAIAGGAYAAVILWRLALQETRGRGA